jgi:hypothetical protein
VDGRWSIEPTGEYGHWRPARSDGVTALVGRRPAVRIELSDESPFARLLVSVRDPEGTLAAVHGATGVRAPE